MTITINGSTGISGVDGSAGTPALQGGDANTGISFGADVVIASTGGVERARVDAGGRLLVGTSSSMSGGDGQFAKLQIVGNSFSASNNAILALGRGEAATSITVDEVLGTIAFTDNAGGEFANIKGIADATAGNSDYPGRLVFSTTADGASSPTERMRIKSDGSVVITANNTSALTTSHTFTAASVGLFRPGTNTEIGWFGGNSPVLKFNAWWDTGVDRLQITDADYTHGVTLSQNSNAWGSYSDARLKQNIAPIVDATQILQSVNPCRFKWKSGLQDDVGFIAQELKPVLPEAVDGEESDFREDEDGRFYGAMAIKYEKLIPVLTAALQEAIAKIETLETKVAALEAA